MRYNLEDDPRVMNGAVSNPDFTACRVAEEDQPVETWRSGEVKQRNLCILAGGVAHNINNALQPIIGYLQLARAEIFPGSPLATYMDEIESATRRLARLSSDMLAYAGKGNNRLELLDISALIGSFEPLLATIAVKPVELRYLLTQDLPLIEADFIQLRRVVAALVTNAVEAIGGNDGVVTIRTGIIRADCQMAKIVMEEDIPEGERLFLEVADTGCGIQPEIVEKIFDPFFSTKLVGRGLGLAAVRGIVRGHGGAIRVESRPGEGTSFRIFFPAVTGPA